MNENLNLCEILKDCPKGEKLYATFLGDVKLVSIINETISVESQTKIYPFFSDGRDELNGELVLFPSRDQRDWSKFVPLSKRFNPKEFKPFDKVLVRKNFYRSVWCPKFFNTLDVSGGITTIDSDKIWAYCIPYNDETMHLVNIKDDCPEYYKWWEEQL